METSEIVDLAGKLNKEVTDNKKVLDGYKAQLKDLGQEVYRDWETDRKSTRLNSSHSGESRMPSSA